MDKDTNLLQYLENSIPKLSKGRKRLALFLINHYDKAVHLTAAKLGEMVDVSESTVVRFAIELGFDGCPKMQKMLEEAVKTKLTAKQRLELMSVKVSGNDNASIIKAVMQSDRDRISAAMDSIDEEAFNKTVDALVKAGRVYIIGERSSHTVAGFFYFYLSMVLKNVVFVNASTTTEVFEQLVHIEAGDVCVGITFPRYSRKTVMAMEYASKEKATVIAITDSYTSPVTMYAAHTLVARGEMLSFVNSLVAPLSLINALLVAVSVTCKEDFEQTLDKLESIWQEYNIYSSKDSNKISDSEQNSNTSCR